MTVLVTIVAVFLSYNANSGLPFVPTYDLKANLPNAAQLVKGFEVRIGGARVGRHLEDRAAKRRTDGIDLRAGHDEARQGDRAAAGATRPCSCARAPRSGLKYVELTPGSRAGRASRRARRSRSRQARPPSSSWTSSSTCSTTRPGSARATRWTASAAGCAGRGQDLNTAIEALVPLVTDLEPVAEQPVRPADAARPVLPLARPTPPREVAPVAEEQASLFVNLDTSFTALAVDRPAVPPGDDLARARRAEEVAIRDFPLAAPVPAQQHRLLPASSGPAWRRCRTRRPILADAFEAGTEVLPQDDPDQRGPRRRVRARSPTSPRTRSCAQGVNQLTRLSARCARRCSFLTPAQTTCNYATLWFRNAASLLSDGDSQRHLAALPGRLGAHGPAQRLRAYGPEQRGRPVERARERPGRAQPPALQPVSEHRRAGPDARSARRGNEHYTDGARR